MFVPADPVEASIADVVTIATASDTRHAFHREGLRAIGRTVGYDTAIIARLDVREAGGPTLQGIDAAAYEAFQARRAVYAADLAPLLRAADAARGVAQDFDVYSLRSRDRLAIYAECIRPSRTCNAIVTATLRVAGRAPVVMQLGRAGAGARFAPRELEQLRALLPAFALGDALHRAASPPRRASPAGVTPREAEVLEYAALALTTAEIARACGTSPFTVKNQLASLCRKLGATNRAELVRIALLEGA